jgi:hypothetical protein
LDSVGADYGWADELVLGELGVHRGRVAPGSGVSEGDGSSADGGAQPLEPAGGDDTGAARRGCVVFEDVGLVDHDRRWPAGVVVVLSEQFMEWAS